MIIKRVIIILGFAIMLSCQCEKEKITKRSVGDYVRIFEYFKQNKEYYDSTEFWFRVRSRGDVASMFNYSIKYNRINYRLPGNITIDTPLYMDFMKKDTTNTSLYEAITFMKENNLSYNQAWDLIQHYANQMDTIINLHPSISNVKSDSNRLRIYAGRDILFYFKNDSSYVSYIQQNANNKTKLVDSVKYPRWFCVIRQ